MNREFSMIIRCARVNRRRFRNSVITLSNNVLKIGPFRIKIREFANIEFKKGSESLLDVVGYAISILAFIAFLFFLMGAVKAGDVFYGVLASIFLFTTVAALALTTKPPKLIIKDGEHCIVLKDPDVKKMTSLYNKLLKAINKRPLRSQSFLLELKERPLRSN